MLLFVVIATSGKPVQAATSSTLNFQARLLSSSGAIVPDGYYNVEFKLYGASSGGSALWTETYYDANGVTAGQDNRLRVVNGYFSAYLGSLTSFPGTIDWDQELWLTMNIGGATQTATPTYDGEMSPRTKLTAVPYAFKAGVALNVASNNTNAASTNSANVSITSGNAAGATSNSGNISIDVGTATQTAGTISIGTANQSGITIGRSGITTLLQGAVSIAGGTNNGVYYRDASGNVVTTAAGSSGECFRATTGSAPSWGSCSGTGDILQGGNTFGAAVRIGSNDGFGLEFETNNTLVASLSSTGAALFQNSTNSTTAFQIQNASGVAQFVADTTNGGLTLGSTAGTGTITLGQSTATNTIAIGSGNTSNGNTQTINIGAGTPTGTGVTNVTIGNNVNAGSTTINSATTNINSPTVSTTATTLALFNTNASTVTALQAATSIGLGATTGTLTVRNANTTLGNAAGSGVFTNNGATFNTTLAVTDDANGGALGGGLAASASVDVYTSISIAQTTASQTITLPTPTASTNYGRLLYISSIGTTSFTMLGTVVSPGTAITVVWSNTNGGASWQIAGTGASANSILNQNASDQTADFRISGTGRANTSFTAPLFDSITGAVALGGTTATGVDIGNTTNTAAITLQGTVGATYTIGSNLTTGTIAIGGTAQTGNITLGSSSGTNSVLIGNGTGATTVNIANANTAGAVNIGAAFTTGTITIGGTGAQTGTIALGTGTGAQTINLATGGTGAKTTTLGSLLVRVLRLLTQVLAT